jgi:hypothetical protein
MGTSLRLRIWVLPESSDQHIPKGAGLLTPQMIYVAGWAVWALDSRED